MKKILITGANSYIGISFVDYMQGREEAYTIETIDMQNHNWNKKSFAGYDVVFHVAGIAHSDTGAISEQQKERYYAVNTKLTLAVATKAKAEGVGQFIFMSSIIVYGNSAGIGKDKQINKDTPTAPANAYGDSKVQAEIGILPLQNASFQIVVLRPPMIYGPGCKGNYVLLSNLAKKLPFFPSIENKRSMLFVDNLCEFIRLMIENKEAGIFYPQNTEYVSTKQMVTAIARVSGKKMPLIGALNPFVKAAGLFTGLVDKAFGNLRYDTALSIYQQNYNVCSFEKSIEKTERK